MTDPTDEAPTDGAGSRYIPPSLVLEIKLCIETGPMNLTAITGHLVSPNRDLEGSGKASAKAALLVP